MTTMKNSRSQVDRDFTFSSSGRSGPGPVLCSLMSAPPLLRRILLPGGGFASRPLVRIRLVGPGAEAVERRVPVGPPAFVHGLEAAGGPDRVGHVAGPDRADIHEPERPADRRLVARAARRPDVGPQQPRE